MSNSKFSYFGGSSWNNIHKRVCGVDLPDHQLQGDTWTLISNSSYESEFLFMVLGSNGLDKVNDMYFKHVHSSPLWPVLIDQPYGLFKFFREKYWHLCDVYSPPTTKLENFDPDTFIDKAYDDVVADIDKVMAIVLGRYEDAKTYHLATVLRFNWSPTVILLAYRLHAYISKMYLFKVIQINGFVHPRHLCRDDIQFNLDGYSLFIDKGLGPLLDSHYNILHKPKCERNPSHLSK